jgi:hypothetical protein
MQETIATDQVVMKMKTPREEEGQDTESLLQTITIMEEILV